MGWEVDLSVDVVSSEISPHEYSSLQELVGKFIGETALGLLAVVSSVAIFCAGMDVMFKMRFAIFYVPEA